MSNHHYIEGLINARAKASFRGAIDAKNLDRWIAHWIECAKDLRKSFEQEGLKTSVQYVDNAIKFATPRPKEDTGPLSEVYRFANGWSAQRERSVVTFGDKASHRAGTFLAFGKWVMRDKQGDPVDMDKEREALFARCHECSFFEETHGIPA